MATLPFARGVNRAYEWSQLLTATASNLNIHPEVHRKSLICIFEAASLPGERFLIGTVVAEDPQLQARLKLSEFAFGVILADSLAYRSIEDVHGALVMQPLFWAELELSYVLFDTRES